MSPPSRSDRTQRSWTPFGWHTNISRSESRDQTGV